MPPSDSQIEQLRKCALTGQYEKGTALALKFLKQSPGDFYFTYQYAKLLGDWADDLPVARRKKLKAEAVRILRPLTKQLAGKTAQIRFGVCLNYYYQAYAFPQMYAYGKRMVRHDRKLGLYAQALGASLIAEKKGSARWARVSLQLWKKYGLKGESYYFPFYCQAVSLAILGERKLAMQNLKTAARLSGRSVGCEEFRELLGKIKS